MPLPKSGDLPVLKSLRRWQHLHNGSGVGLPRAAGSVIVFIPGDRNEYKIEVINKLDKY